MSSNSRLLSKEPILSCIISQYDREEIMFSTCPQNLRKLDKWMTREEVSKTIVDEQCLKVTSSGNGKQQRPDAGPESCIWSSSFICCSLKSQWSQWKGGCLELLLMEGKRGEKAHVWQITQELD